MKIVIVTTIALSLAALSSASADNTKPIRDGINVINQLNNGGRGVGPSTPPPSSVDTQTRPHTGYSTSNDHGGHKYVPQYDPPTQDNDD